jgi:hypothetical protein
MRDPYGFLRTTDGGTICNRRFAGLLLRPEDLSGRQFVGCDFRGAVFALTPLGALKRFLLLDPRLDDAIVEANDALELARRIVFTVKATGAYVPLARRAITIAIACALLQERGMRIAVPGTALGAFVAAAA